LLPIPSQSPSPTPTVIPAAAPTTTSISTTTSTIPRVSSISRPHTAMTDASAIESLPYLPYVSGTTDVSDVPPASTSASTAATGTASVNNGAIAGGVIGALIALAALYFVLKFFVRARQKRHKDQDGFDENLFKRRSSFISEGPPSSMLEQGVDNVAAASHSKQVSYDATYLNRPNSLDFFDSAQYVDLDHSSNSPYQATQHAEISHSFNTEPPQPRRPESGSLHDLEEAFRSLDDFPPVPTSLPSHLEYGAGRLDPAHVARGPSA